MKIKNFLYNASCALVMGSVLLTAMGCPDDKSSAKKEVTNCSEITVEDDCNLSSQKDKKKCIYHGGKCEVLVQGGGGNPPTGKCEDFGTDAAKCGLHIHCAIANGKCADAASDCGNVKDQNACTNTFGKYCAWTAGAAGAAGTCAAKSPANVDIYTWKKLTLPAGTAAVDLTHFVVSGDNNHAYAFTTDAANGNAARGLYHSGDKGATWAKFTGAAPNDGIVRGKADPGATTDSDWDSTASNAVDLKATQLGAVVSTVDGIWLLEGANVKWGILQAVNQLAAVTAADRVPGFQNQPIGFIDVVDINTVETVAFGQAAHATTQYNLLLKRTDTNTAPLMVPIIKSGAGGALTDAQVWVRAGNTHDGDLLLASVVGNQTNAGTGIWQVPAANLPPALVGGPMPGDLGKVATDANGTLFPEDGEAWRGNAGSSNIGIQVIGSFDNNPAHEFFAGMRHTGAARVVGGLAHYTGPQAGNNAELELFGQARISVLGLNNFGGVTRLVTSSGLKGVAIDGTAMPANDFAVNAFASDKNEMMDGTKAAVPFGLAHNAMLVNLFGDADLSWYWFDRTGADPQAGLFVREKVQGQPRP